MARYVIAATRLSIKNMTERLARRTGSSFTLIRHPEELTVGRLSAIKPSYVFFPHWSFIIPPAIYIRFRCVIFHMTDVPFGRGGTPLQNLIVRGMSETKVSALRCGPILDGGPVYLKRPLSLFGTAEDIYLRAARLVEEMILEIITKHLKPAPQRGKPTYFVRRKPAQSNIHTVSRLNALFDHIRMLDAEGYPKAFLHTKNFRLEFQRASLKDDRVTAQVTITKRNHA
jgi:methionyl-tRNA formyltransferase